MINSKRAITLIELLTVIIIIGILAALALPNFGTMRERALDKEAKANLKLIQAAEKIYRMEMGCYYPCDGSTKTKLEDINPNLKLSLTEKNWDYEVEGGTTTFSAKGSRDISGSNWDRTYRIDHDDEEACCCPNTSSACPSEDRCASCP